MGGVGFKEVVRVLFRHAYQFIHLLVYTLPCQFIKVKVTYSGLAARLVKASLLERVSRTHLEQTKKGHNCKSKHK